MPTDSETPAEIDSDAWGEDGLTLKQRRFCELYVGEAAGNASKAALLAGYSENCVSEQGHENLRKPHVRSYIGRLLAKHAMTPEFLKSRLAQLAQSSLDHCTRIDDNGELVVDLKMAAENGALGQFREVRPVLMKIDGKEVVSYRVSTHDPLKAIETLLKMYGTLFDKHVVSGPDNGPVQVQSNGPDLTKLSETELLQMTALLTKAGA